MKIVDTSFKQKFYVGKKTFQFASSMLQINLGKEKHIFWHI